MTRSRFFFSTIGGLILDADYQAVIDYATLQGYSIPSTGQQRKQNQLLLDLKSTGAWSELDLLYVFATNGDADFAKINWKSPGDFTAVENGTLTFTTLEGFTGDGATGYLNTGWAPSPDAVHFTQNEGGAFIYVNNDHSAGSKTAFGCRGTCGSGTDGQTLFYPKLFVSSDNRHSLAVNSQGTNTGAGVSANGFYHIRRITSNDQRLFKNGAQVGVEDTTSVSTPVSTRDLAILATNYQTGLSTYSDAQVGCFGIGASMTGKESALYTAWNDYFTAL